MEPYLGQISLVAFGWAPLNWALCNGATLNITQNSALYSLIANKFGGDGRTTFCLPDFRGRTPVGTTQYNSNSVANPEKYLLGVSQGAEQVTLTNSTMPPHTHFMNVSTDNGSAGIEGKFYAQHMVTETKAANNDYVAPPAVNTLVGLGNPVTPFGGDGSHNNMQPYQALTYIIATSGLYPEHQ